MTMSAYSAEHPTDTRIEGLHLANAAIVGRDDRVGGLVGFNAGGSIVRSRVSGKVSGTDKVGGLVGFNAGGRIVGSRVSARVSGSNEVGGIVGASRAGTIVNSYAANHISGLDKVGGLVGTSAGDTIVNSYGRGILTARDNLNSDARIGGLVGTMDGGSLSDSYSIVNIISDLSGADTNPFTRTGGLVGTAEGAVQITNSYTAGVHIQKGDTLRATGGLVGSVDSGSTATLIHSYQDATLNPGGLPNAPTRKTTAELQSPPAAGTTSTETYYGWRDSDWDFGTTEQYPALKYAVGSDSDNPACSADIGSVLPLCGDVVPNQRGGLRSLVLSNRSEDGQTDTSDRIELRREVYGAKLGFNYTVLSYDVVARHDASPILDITPHAFNGDAEISIKRSEDDSDYFADKRSGEASDAIRLDLQPEAETTVAVTVAASGETPIQYALTVRVLNEFTVAEAIEMIGGDRVVDEGETVNLSIAATLDPNLSYRYNWQPTAAADIAEADDLILSGQDSDSLSFTVPDYFIRSDTATNTQVNFTVTIEDTETGLHRATRSKEITIRKIDNATPDIDLQQSTATLTIVSDLSEADSAAGGTYTYLWQRRTPQTAGWMDVGTTATYWIPSGGRVGSNRYRVNVSHIDDQGYETDYSLLKSFILEPLRLTTDDNGNGFTDIYYLEDLDAIREDLDGDYQVRISLDFNEAAHYIDSANQAEWTTGEGWQPIGIGGDTFSSDAFSGTIIANAANDHSVIISNLTINRPTEDSVGLFARTEGLIGGIRLSGVDVKGRFMVGGLVGEAGSGLIANSSVEGTVTGEDAWVGGVVGSNFAAIINSYAKGSVKGHSSVGGLAGYSYGPITHSYAVVDVEAKAHSGGLVGYNDDRLEFGSFGGKITNSYASGRVTGGFNAGGLVGYNENGTIVNAYASGDVIGSGSVGGLVGYNANSSISDAYALGAVAGGIRVGGLVGYNEGNVPVNSYWDRDTSGIAVSAGGTPQTTVALLSATAPGTNPTEAYYNWSDSDWDFGSAGAEKYPTLKYRTGQDSYGYTLCGADVLLPDCGSDLPEQEQPGNSGHLVLAELTLSSGALEPSFDPTKENYELLDIADGQTTVAVVAGAAPRDTSLQISILVGDGEISRGTTMASAEVMLGDLTSDMIVIRLTAAEQSTKEYTISLAEQPNLSGSPLSADCDPNDIDKDGNGLIEICDIEGLYAMRYPLADGYTGYELKQDLDFDNPAHYRHSGNKPIWTTHKGWRPIGTFANPFATVFTAKGRTISNMTIDRDNGDYAGLFGVTTSDAEIYDVGLTNTDVRGRFWVGGLVGWNDGGTITNSYVTGRVSGIVIVGGLAGEHSGPGRINNSYAVGVVVSGNRLVGGLVGAIAESGRVINSHAVTDTEGRVFVGGLIGYHAGTIRSSYAGGVAEGIYYVGGLVGLNDNNIMSSYATADAEGYRIVGGLVGDNRGNIRNSYVAGAVSGVGADVGALAGSNSAAIEDSYAAGGFGDFAVGISFIGSNAYRERNAEVVSSAELRASTEAGSTSTDVYYEWDSDTWDFSGDGNYPTLKYTAGDDANDPACDSDPATIVPQCADALSGQQYILTDLDVRNTELFPSYDIDRTNYYIDVANATTNVVIIVTAENYPPPMSQPTTDVVIIATVENSETPLAVNDVSVAIGAERIVLPLTAGQTEEISIRVRNVGTTRTYIVAVTRASAEQGAAFVQSRFAGQPENTNCAACDPDQDGVVRMRLERVELSDENGESNTNTVGFKVQMKRAASDLSVRVPIAGFALDYNADLFGNNLNVAVPTADYSDGIGCRYTPSDFFAVAHYDVAFMPLDADTLGLRYESVAAGAAAAELSATVGAEWRDILTMTCRVLNNNDNAISAAVGLAIAGLQPRDIRLRKQDNGNTIISTALLLADNDLRGLRLGDETYAKDYARYSDGAGVRVEFSRGINTQLSSQHFVIRSADGVATVQAVRHDPGSPYVDITTSMPLEDAVVRISTATGTIEDADGNPLADGSFIAALAYDAAAPVVEIIEEVSTGTWNIIFDKAIQGNGLSVDSLCVADVDGICPPLGQVTGTSITSVELNADSTMLQVEIASADQTSRTAAVEFRRNAVLGADFKVVEEYQTASREQIIIEDGVAPTITVEAAADAEIQNQDYFNITYNMSFTVSANEAVAALGHAESYRLLLITEDDEAIRLEDTPASVVAAQADNTVTVTYEDVEIAADTIKTARGFTLARSSDTALDDLSGKDPLGHDTFSDTEPLDATAAAVANTAALDTNAQLTSLSLLVATLDFDPDIDDYEIENVPNATTHTTITAAATATAIILRIGSESIDNREVDDHRVALTEGAITTITVVVVAQDRETMRVYTVAVQRLPSTDATLSGLQLSSGELVPSFMFDTTAYVAQVRGERNITVAPTANHPQATIQITKDGDDPVTDYYMGKTSGEPSAAIELNEETTTTLSVLVTAQDRDTQTQYTVEIDYLGHIRIRTRVFLEGSLE